MAPLSHPAWYRSFYWRIGIYFVLFVLLILATQSVIFSYIIARDNAQDPYRSPNLLANAVASDVSAALTANRGLDVGEYLESRYGGERTLFVVMRDGTTAGNTAEILAENMRSTVMATFGPTGVTEPRETSGRTPLLVTAPVQIDQELLALVVLPPPPSRGGITRELGRFLSLPSTFVLILTTVAVAIVIFGPARRRLAGLEAAAVRLGNGDLSARAPQTGGDEIARVAGAFNRMAVELEARDAALRTSDQLRRRMLADVSHELKTPLTAMRGYIETLRMPEIALDPERRDRYFDTIDRETRRLERILKDLLDLARYEHGSVALNQRVFDVERLFQSVAGRHEAEAAARSIRIHVNVEEEADQVVGDPDRIEQVVENLVANALRHTPAGGTIDVRAGQANGAAVLSVSDSGEGIAAEHLPHVFERFYKVDPARASETTGSGLGLSITKAIVERHGGTIRVASQPGRTTFTIQLPQPNQA